MTGAPAAPTLVLLARRRRRPGKSFRNIARVDVMPVADAGVADVIGAASLLVSEAALPELVARAAGDGRGAEEGELMEPSQVIIRPVVSEKTFVLAEAGKYTFRVHDRAHKTQIRQAIEQLFDVKVRRGPHRVGQEQAQAPRPDVGHARATGRRRSSRCGAGDTIPIFRGLEGTE